MGSLGALLLLPALGGYLFLVRCNATRDSIQVATGYHVVFRSAVTGIFLFALCRPLVLVLDAFFPEVSALWRSIFQIAHSGTAALTVVLGYISPLFSQPLHRSFDARNHNGDLILVPIWSTHRHAETLEPQAPINYAPIIRKAISAGEPLSNFSVAIPLSTVQSVRLFDPSYDYPASRNSAEHQTS